MEDRALLAVTAFAGGTLTINVNNASESVHVSNNGTNIYVTSTFGAGPDSEFATGTVNRIDVLDSGNHADQLISFSGETTFMLSAGLTSEAVETVNFYNAVIATGTSSLIVNAPRNIFVSASVTGIGTSNSEAVRLDFSGRIASGNNAAITVTADSVNIFANSLGINSGSGTTTLRTRTAGTLINLGGADVLSGSLLTLGLSSDELNQISAGTLVIGSTVISTGSITVSAAIAPANVTTLLLTTGASVIDGNDSGIDITVENIGITAAIGVAISANPLEIDATNFEASGGTGGVFVTDPNSLTIGNVSAGLTGVSATSSGGISITTAAGLSVRENITAANGILTLSANQQATPTSGNFTGINVNGATVTTAGGGNVLLQGLGGNSGADNQGVRMQSGGVVSGGGTVTVEGTGGASAGTHNFGVYVVGTNSQITSSGGAVSVTGIGTSNSEAVRLESSGRIASGNNAAITVTADSVNILADSLGINSGSGTATLRTRTAGSLINLGGADVLSGSLLTLGLSSDELNQISAGTLVIGSTVVGTGSITVSGDITRPAPTNMQLLTAGDITISGGQINTGGTLLLDAGASSAIRPTRSGLDVTASTLTFGSGDTLAMVVNGQAVDTQYTQLSVVGQVNLIDVVLAISGSYQPNDPDTFIIIDNDGSDPVIDTFTGLVEGALVTINGGAIQKRITYTYPNGTGNDVALIPQAVGRFVNHFGFTGAGSPADTNKVMAKEGATPTLLTYNNLINTSRGINGLGFDIANLQNTLTTADFQFQMSPQFVFNEATNPPSNWVEAPAPLSLIAPPDILSRVLIRWPDNAITNRWLRVTVKATANTGLQAPEVYYIGHLLGETTGPSGSTFTVSFADIIPIRSAVGSSVNASSNIDIDKNGTVAFADISAMRPNVGAQLTIITIPASGTSGGQMLLSGGLNDDRPKNGGLNPNSLDLSAYKMAPQPVVHRSDDTGRRSDRFDSAYRELGFALSDRIGASGTKQPGSQLGTSAIDWFYRSMAEESERKHLYTSSDSDADKLLDSLLDIGNLAFENGGHLE